MTDLKPVQLSPTELLARQVQQLTTLNTRIDDVLKAQQMLAGALADVTAAVVKSHGVLHIKVMDINMPFWNLVGFIVKVFLAAIPAYVVLGMLGAVALALLGTSCAALLGR